MLFNYCVILVTLILSNEYQSRIFLWRCIALLNKVWLIQICCKKYPWKPGSRIAGQFYLSYERLLYSLFTNTFTVHHYFIRYQQMPDAKQAMMTKDVNKAWIKYGINCIHVYFSFPFCCSRRCVYKPAVDLLVQDTSCTEPFIIEICHCLELIYSGSDQNKWFCYSLPVCCAVSPVWVCPV